jgi:tetratricopeptide (TPR) repeat protein
MLSGFPYRLAFLPVLLISAAACTSSAAVKAESIRLGDELVAQRQYGQAAVAYRQAMNADSQDGKVRAKLAYAYQLAGRNAEAATQAEQAARLMPADLDVQLNAGTLLLWQSRFVDTVDRMSPVLRDHPDNVTALLIFANAKARLFSSTWALEKLAEPVRDGGRFEGARRAQTADHVRRMRQPTSFRGHTSRAGDEKATGGRQLSVGEGPAGRGEALLKESPIATLDTP